jgi:hypothetical protein
MRKYRLKLRYVPTGRLRLIRDLKGKPRVFNTIWRAQAIATIKRRQTSWDFPSVIERVK